MSLVIDILSWAFLLLGSFFVVTGGIGVIRMPDLFTRLHAAAVTDTCLRNSVAVSIASASTITF